MTKDKPDASVARLIIIVEEEEASLPSPGILETVCDVVVGCVSATPRDSKMESASGAKDSIGGILEAVATVEPPAGSW